MDERVGSFKVLEEVHLKATYNTKINGKEFVEGETIALFDKIQVSGLEEVRNYVAARGGFDNRGHVFWETTKEIYLTFHQGVFSNTQFGLLTNSNVLKIEEDDPLLITKMEELESDENGNIHTSEEAMTNYFVYKKSTGERLNCWKVGAFLKINEVYTDVIAIYQYNYLGGASAVKIGQRALGGFLELEGKTRVKDDSSGLITTGIIKIPKLKLMSGLSIKLGAQANPVVGSFKAVGVPVESRSDSYVLEFDFLNTDIDSDM